MKAVLLAALCACATARRSEPVAGPMELSGLAAEGELLYERHCHACHPGGEGGLGPSLNDKPQPGFLIRTQVRMGFGAMPGFDAEHLAKHEVDAIVAWMQAARRHGQ